jgi:hypothetical protein
VGTRPTLTADPNRRKTPFARDGRLIVVTRRRCPKSRLVFRSVGLCGFESHRGRRIVQLRPVDEPGTIQRRSRSLRLVLLPHLHSSFMAGPPSGRSISAISASHRSRYAISMPTPSSMTLGASTGLESAVPVPQRRFVHRDPAHPLTPEGPGMDVMPRVDLHKRDSGRRRSCRLTRRSRWAWPLGLNAVGRVRQTARKRYGGARMISDFTVTR